MSSVIRSGLLEVSSTSIAIDLLIRNCSQKSGKTAKRIGCAGPPANSSSYILRTRDCILSRLPVAKSTFSNLVRLSGRNAESHTSVTNSPSEHSFRSTEAIGKSRHLAESKFEHMPVHANRTSYGRPGIPPACLPHVFSMECGQHPVFLGGSTSRNPSSSSGNIGRCSTLYPKFKCYFE